MNMSTRYVMNPAEDMIRFGEEITEGMLVLAEDPSMRSPHGDTEDDLIRQQRFRRITRLRREPARGDQPARVIFVGEWVDGYQEVHSYAEFYGWIVKREQPGSEEEAS